MTEKKLGPFCPTYPNPKLMSAACCVISGIKGPYNCCLGRQHGKQSCQEIRQIARETVSKPELQQMQRFGLGNFLPWRVLIETPKTVVLADYNGLPIVRFTEGRPARIIHPGEIIFWTQQEPFFPPGAEPQDKDGFTAAFLLAVAYGLWNEVAWRSVLSDFGERPLSEWSANWRSYSQGTFDNYQRET
jgi:hypothetical protein